MTISPFHRHTTSVVHYNTAELRRIRRKAMSRAILREIAISLVWTIVGTVALLVGLAIAVVTS